ncbi:Phthiodiolone/phenolphthiodiolone dimycocerosates ketoreductase [Frankliniella fusca]|uniref:Phthiodiolone/phenolphthiodiolone dimycocerosates ketoreductase n=1 Tax=Frankliniella fusca TaxID=407009 RepID=A0AAE1L5P5_9NEOP|nr:Phthiodiolone/phenolphthiodiolone dimycocerosates ketoreductase [Frankliniella fusca]
MEADSGSGNPALVALRAATLCLAVLGAAASDGSGAEFLQSVMNRIGGKPDAPQSQDLARPVADLQAALERVSATMAAAGVDVLPASSQHAEQAVMVPSDGLEGPPFVLAVRDIIYPRCKPADEQSFF